MYWILMALFGLYLSVRAGKQCFLQKASVHVYLMLAFIVFSANCGYIAYVWGAGKSTDGLEPVWAVMTVIVGLLLTPVFYKHFYMLAGDFGGICLEGGFLGMVAGLILLITHAYYGLTFLGMSSLAFFFLGYARLQNLLLHRTGNG